MLKDKLGKLDALKDELGKFDELKIEFGKLDELKDDRVSLMSRRMRWMSC